MAETVAERMFRIKQDALAYQQRAIQQSRLSGQVYYRPRTSPRIISPTASSYIQSRQYLIGQYQTAQRQAQIGGPLSTAYSGRIIGEPTQLPGGAIQTTRTISPTARTYIQSREALLTKQEQAQRQAAIAGPLATQTRVVSPEPIPQPTSIPTRRVGTTLPDFSPAERVLYERGGKQRDAALQLYYQRTGIPTERIVSGEEFAQRSYTEAEKYGQESARYATAAQYYREAEYPDKPGTLYTFQTAEGPIELSGAEATVYSRNLAELYGQEAIELGKYQAIAAQISKESSEWHPDTKVKIIKKDGKVSYEYQFPYSGAEEYGRYRRELEKGGFGAQLATAFTGTDPLGLRSLYHTVIGEREKGQQLKTQALTTTHRQGFGAYYVTSPLGAIGLGYGVGAGVGAAIAPVGAYVAAQPVAQFMWNAAQAGIGGAMIGFEAADIEKSFKASTSEGIGKLTLIGLGTASGIAGFGAGGRIERVRYRRTPSFKDPRGDYTRAGIYEHYYQRGWRRHLLRTTGKKPKLSRISDALGPSGLPSGKESPLRAVGSADIKLAEQKLVGRAQAYSQINANYEYLKLQTLVRPKYKSITERMRFEDVEAYQGAPRGLKSIVAKFAGTKKYQRDILYYGGGTEPRPVRPTTGDLDLGARNVARVKGVWAIAEKKYKVPAPDIHPLIKPGTIVQPTGARARVPIFKKLGAGKIKQMQIGESLSRHHGSSMELEHIGRLKDIPRAYEGMQYLFKVRGSPPALRGSVERYTQHMKFLEGSPVLMPKVKASQIYPDISMSERWSSFKLKIYEGIRGKGWAEKEFAFLERQGIPKELTGFVGGTGGKPVPHSGYLPSVPKPIGKAPSSSFAGFTSSSYYTMPSISSLILPSRQITSSSIASSVHSPSLSKSISNTIATMRGSLPPAKPSGRPSTSPRASQSPSISISPSRSPSRSPSISPSPSPSLSPSFSPSISPSASPSRSPSPSPSASPSPSPSPSASPSPSPSPSPSASPSPSPSPSPSASPSPYPSYHMSGVLIPPRGKRGTRRGLEDGYDVFVKDRVYVKGKKTYRERYRKLNRAPMTEDKALGYGAHAVDHSSAATFYIKESKKGAKTPLLNFNTWEKQENQFYQRKLKDGRVIYIEKTQHRISTQGEIKGISALGWRSQIEHAQGVDIQRRINKRTRVGSKHTSRIDKNVNDFFKEMAWGF